MSMDKIIFLDIDGVLNSTKYMIDNPGERNNLRALDIKAIRRLEKILKETNASMVISSTWRLSVTIPDIQFCLVNAGMERSYTWKIIGATPYLSQQRGTEIDCWLNHAPPISKFVIIDDSSDMDPHKSRLVRTSTMIGLQGKQVKEAIHMLNES